MKQSFNSSRLYKHLFTHLFRILKYGTSYALATGFFPSETAKKVLLLYSFVRIPDNIVDEITPCDNLEEHYRQAQEKLETMQYSRTQAYTACDRQDAQRAQYIVLFDDNAIPFQYSLDFFAAMIADCTRHRYQTFAELEHYMYGSASVVGLMMYHIVGFVDDRDEDIAKSYAVKLGNAMQLTNFLRDIREDYEELERIYMPQELLKQFGLTHEDIIRGCADDTKDMVDQESWKLFMQEMIARCRSLYRESLEGLQYLNPEGRKAIRLAAVLYESILDKIERKNYDVFNNSCRTSMRDKAKTFYRFKSLGFSSSFPS